ncbi:APC family permease [Allonocardiopsis opalescens]|uniref:Amino acid exporter (AAE family) n=1 Tax=Allonocardiopsis opalescens TaxID=1144618 RepID=A0A2T0PXF8_9ACTN|nr:APC family permease [Allonocardiopsis opalescens]PRX96223.1 amino acid exporter (AAE family) [Allonocardiopsis opalescens]
MARISAAQGTALYVGAVLGSGVITLPSLAAQVAGPASLLAWAGLALASVPIAAAFAALGARFPDSGGLSTYARRAFGPRAAAVAGWLFYAAMPLGIPPLALMGAGYVTSAAGGAGAGATLLVAAAILAPPLAANAVGLRLSGRMQLAVTLVLALLLVAAVVLSLPHADPGNLTPFAPHGLLAVGSAAGLLLWAFHGWEAVPQLSAEFADPRRDIPRATAAALVVICGLYLAVATTCVLVLGPAAAGTQAPLALLLARGLDSSAVHIAAAVIAVVIIIGTVNTYLASAAKLGAALGRDGALPAWFARGAAPGAVPRRSLAVVAALSSLGLAVAVPAGAGLDVMIRTTIPLVMTVAGIGLAAGVRLLPARTPGWWCALAATGSVGLLLAMSGWYLLTPPAVAAAALGYLRLRERWAARRPGAQPSSRLTVSGENAGRQTAMYSAPSSPGEL